jgi:sporulation protein YlmC with PRC-barrel domain
MQRTITGMALAASLAGWSLAPMSMALAADIAFLTDQNSGEWLAVRLGGSTVLNTKGDVIGRVEDVVLDANGQSQAVIVGVGGFLGVGSKQVGVPYKSIHVGNVVGSRRLVVLDVTKEQLQAAPNYKATDPTKTDQAKQKVAEWAKIAKDKAIDIGHRAAEATKGSTDQMKSPTSGAQAPAPKS